MFYDFSKQTLNVINISPIYPHYLNKENSGLVKSNC